ASTRANSFGRLHDWFGIDWRPFTVVIDRKGIVAGYGRLRDGLIVDQPGIFYGDAAFAPVVTPLVKQLLARAEPEGAAVHLPRPLDRVAIDLGYLKPYFDVVDAKLFEPYRFGDFSTPPREISEQVLVWTLEAKVPEIPGRTVSTLFPLRRP